MVNTGSGLRRLSTGHFVAFACYFSQQDCVRLNKCTRMAIGGMRIALHRPIGQRTGLSGSVRRPISASEDLPLEKQFKRERRERTRRRSMEVEPGAVELCCSAACCGIAAPRDFSLGRSGGKPHSAAARSSSTAKPHPHRRALPSGNRRATCALPAPAHQKPV